ncbi:MULTISPECIES: hypothetical protein [unclassified Adlercreutzia]|uniref:hypothetical protein n=1 Tax=unclassified Adlercreutzia TaxID=2636013 RepID=UPI0013EC29E5|nr:MULTISPECIES: hypothetical protein [unclassified Adlercreutzia]
MAPVVNAKAYHDAFMRIPVSKAVAHSVYTQAGRVLQRADGTQFEYLVAVDARTGALVADNLSRDPKGEGRTGFGIREAKAVLACENGVLFVHNHPASTQPSFADVMTAAAYECVHGGVVVGHDGSVWYYAAKGLDVRFAEALRRSFKASYGDRADVEVLKELLRIDKKHRSFEMRRLR